MQFRSLLLRKRGKDLELQHFAALAGMPRERALERCVGLLRLRATWTGDGHLLFAIRGARWSKLGICMSPYLDVDLRRKEHNVPELAQEACFMADIVHISDFCHIR